jgi:hypothetical protein
MRSRRSPALRWITLNPRVYLLNAFNGLDDRTPHVFHLLLGGQQRPFAPDWKAIDPGLRITTRLIRIPIRGSGSGSGSGAFVQQRPARRIGTTVIHGRGALLLAEPDYPHGGIQGGHVLVLWNQNSHGYIASVHGTDGMTRGTLAAIVIALARSTTQ